MLAFSSCVGSETNVSDFLKKHPSCYQDILVRNQVIASGSDICATRYDLLKPILDSFEQPFSVLDLGAAQGYFSFSIAHDYPNSSCLMIDANTSYYGNHGDVLYDLCVLNSDLTNIAYLNRAISLPDLEFLNREEHFDMIIAFLVIHLMDDKLQKQIKIIENLLQLTDNLIIEVASDVGVNLSSYVEYLSTKMDCQYLGEVRRHKDLWCPRRTDYCPCTGKTFWFRSKSSQHKPSSFIKKKTFLHLNGVYPLSFDTLLNPT